MNNQPLNGTPCPTCQGKKTVLVRFYDSGGSVAGIVESRCNTCRGTGVVGSTNACVVCLGSKTVVKSFGNGDGKLEARCDHCNGTGFEPDATA